MSPSAWSWDPLILLSVGLVAIVVCAWSAPDQAAHQTGRAGALASVGVRQRSGHPHRGAAVTDQHLRQQPVQHAHAAAHAPGAGRRAVAVIGAPLLPLLWGLPDQERRGVGRLLSRHGLLRTLGHRITQPLVAEVLFLSTLACWHVPVLYDAAQGRSITHNLEHALLLGTAALFWWPLLPPTGASKRMSRGLGVVYLAAAAVEGTVIGALLTFSSEPLDTTYRLAPRSRSSQCFRTNSSPA